MTWKVTLFQNWYHQNCKRRDFETLVVDSRDNKLLNGTKYETIGVFGEEI